ncbi:hypothetical protein [Petralouisia muris]|jgi:uncharacterized Fe-S cluster-containing MiaB family protein|uniref:hypothetical protein n=1 Tax=Petralouisia muris TaxID=3032872 RepID=UPI0023B79BE3|nr:hypothetical protein [Petralouisia muris]
MKEHLIKQVMEIMQKIEDTQDLIKIYTVAKTYYEIQLEEEVRAEHGGTLQNKAD